MAKGKYYVVWLGKKPGIYASWAECQQQIHQYKGAKYKAFPSKIIAERAFNDGWEKHWGTTYKTSKNNNLLGKYPEQIDYDSISVDVGTHGNPGPVEYRGVDTKTGNILFSVGPISKGTNNLGEFLALVHGLAYLKELDSNKAIYTDSENAIKWVQNKQVATTLPRDESTVEIWELIDDALEWLHSNEYKNKILKWDTKSWGEIKADYGRK